MENRYHIFVSYSRANSDIKDKIVQDLREYGFAVWVDSSNIALARNWTDEIKRGISQSKILLYLASPEAVDSTYISYELGYADALNKIILPVRIKGHTWEECIPSWYSVTQGRELRGMQYDKRKLQFFDSIVDLMSKRVHSNLVSDELVTAQSTLKQVLQSLHNVHAGEIDDYVQEILEKSLNLFGPSYTFRSSDTIMKSVQLLEDWGLLDMFETDAEDGTTISTMLTTIGERIAEDK